MNLRAKMVIALAAGVLLACLGAGLRSATTAPAAASTSWNQKAAAAYLDRRAEWWMAWPVAARDHQTFCISCHTALPYALARPVLRMALGEQTPSPNERRLLDNVIKRVRLWDQEAPFYADQVGARKSLQSRGTESVLNALILASSDSRTGKLSEDTRAAFKNMWALQQTAGDGRGAWPWLDFGNEPFEAKDSAFYAACLAAVAVGTTPENVRTTPELRGRLKLLDEYLNRNYASQSLINQVALLWAAAKLPGLLTLDQRHSIVDKILGTQRTDGGWSLSSLSWTWNASTPKSLVKLWIRSEGTPLEAISDGYATGLVAFTLEQSGFPNEDLHLQKALAWLARNQNEKEGRWQGYSLNHAHDSTPMGLFMSDAATAYAVLALEGAR